MSNHLAIATVTSVLGQTVGAAVGDAVSGATVTTLRPDAPNNTPSPQPRVNLYLYQVSPNAAWRNSDLPTRAVNGQMTQKPQEALDLHYLLTFFGDDGQLEPQRLLGSAVTTLHARPVLTREAIQGVIQTAVAANPDHYLADSDLSEQVELVKFSPLPLNLEELSKLWSVFFQTPYALSVAYRGSVVLLEADGSPQQAAPVRERHVYVGPKRRPVIEQLLSRSSPDEPALANRPILPSDDLIVRGRELRGGTTRVLAGEIEATLKEVGDTQIVFSLPTRLQAGTWTVRVIRQARTVAPAAPRWSAESNAAPFELRPHVTSASVTNVRGSGDDLRSADITVRLRPEVGGAQRVTLLLNERYPPDTRPARSYSFDAPPETRPNDPETSASLTIPIDGLVPGRYLVRVRVDGAESLLKATSSGKYSTPQVEIP